MKHFFEIDDRGCVYQLSVLACGEAPCGGEVVYASSKNKAQDLYFRYRNGEKALKRDLWISNYHGVYVNVIHENASFKK